MSQATETNGSTFPSNVPHFWQDTAVLGSSKLSSVSLPDKRSYHENKNGVLIANRTETYPNAILSTINLTQTGPSSKLGLRAEGMATNELSYGSVCLSL